MPTFYMLLCLHMLTDIWVSDAEHAQVRSLHASGGLHAAHVQAELAQI